MKLDDKKYNYILFTILIIFFLAFELIAMNLAYENFGWYLNRILYLFLFLNLIPIFLFIFNKKGSSIFSLIFIGFFIIPIQFYYANINLKLKEEGANITSFVYQEKLKTGQFPLNLSSYKYKYPRLKNHFFYRNEKKDFTVGYYVGSETSSDFHYGHKRGKWEYYDD